MQLKNPEDLSSLAETLAYTLEYKAYISRPGSLSLRFVGSCTEEKGTTMIPFLMTRIMLNIAASMLGAAKERRNEIASMPSIGLNPTHVAALFVAEAAVIGIIGSGFGYLLGILGYRLASTGLLGTLQVREKVSARWGLMTILLSVSTTVLVALISAMQVSTIITPSLLRKWWLKESEKPLEKGWPWRMQLPIKIKAEEVKPFTRFMLETMREAFGTVTDIRLTEEATDKGSVKRLRFRYALPDQNEWSRNEIMVRRAEVDNFSAELFCVPSENLEETVHKTSTH
ncbi:MAG: FtsX-like permease family protein [Candidatus Bathyarchaeota archaeon]|nr:FtsX-like permease family protein [Candidatus Bathyarchaeota archaeon]